jgi:hypothetical protein
LYVTTLLQLQLTFLVQVQHHTLGQIVTHQLVYAASGTGNIAAFTATNTGSTAVTSTIIVTPVFTGGSVSCNGPTQTFTITVNPTPNS